jgi:hypothetical protein
LDQMVTFMWIHYQEIFMDLKQEEIGKKNIRFM